MRCGKPVRGDAAEAAYTFRRPAGAIEPTIEFLGTGEAWRGSGRVAVRRTRHWQVADQQCTFGLHRRGATYQDVIGREFSYRLLAAIAPTAGAPLEAALAQLGAAELIFARGEPPDSTYIFKHALVQEAAYASLLHSKRQRLHGQIADALIERFPEIIELHPGLMAHHLANAGLTERAIEYLQIAGERAIQRSANVEAIGHLKRALEL